MKSKWRAVFGLTLSGSGLTIRDLAVCSLLLGAAMVFSSVPAAAQAPETGALEFQAQVTPSGGQPEPTRQIAFYLLRKDLADIRAEAQRDEPPQDLDHFVDGLDVSPELKVWIKKNRVTDFTGVDFTKSLKAEDIITTPEFLQAYKNLNGAILNVTLPASQMKESDRVKHPEKYQHEKEQYERALRQYIAANPASIEGLDAELGDKNPSRRWSQVQSEQKRRTEQRVAFLAQTQYLAGKAVSDLNGRGALAGLPPGTYWITTLDVPAMAGDVRLQWDSPVTIRAGQTTNIELSNLNAILVNDQMNH